MYGGDYGQMRFSDLDQINRETIGKLKPAWITHTGIYNMASGYQTTPVIIGRDMYVTTPRVGSSQHVLKLDAKTGKIVWNTSIPLGRARYCCGPNNRGATLYRDKVYIGTLDSRLIALDAKTGKSLWQTVIAPAEEGYSQTSAPVAFDGKIILGTAGGEFGIRGFLKAFDADTGELLWTWDTIPSPEQGGWEGTFTETAPGLDYSLNRDIAREKADVSKYPDAWKHGGVPIWTTPSVDPELGLVYVTTGNPGPDYNGTIRPGDNLWGDSLCAIRAEDGTMAWCFQYVPHDLWDYDGGSPPVLFDIDRDGKSVPVVGIFTKLGFFYLFDRQSGELLKVSEAYVPQKDLFIVPGEKGAIVTPGSAGGTNYSPGAYSPLTGYVYSANVHWPMKTTQRDIGEWSPNRDYQGGNASFGTKGVERWGNVAALEPISGKVVWKTRTELPLFSGVLVTAGQVVFAGQSDASFDAWDAETGKHLWGYETRAGCNAAPATYLLDGRQYVVISAGGSRYVRRPRNDPPEADAIIAFALP